MVKKLILNTCLRRITFQYKFLNYRRSLAVRSKQFRVFFVTRRSIRFYSAYFIQLGQTRPDSAHLSISWSADRRTCSSIHAVASNSSFSWNSFSITQWAFRKCRTTIVITAVLYRPDMLRRRCGTISVIKINSARGAGSGSTWLRLKWYVR